MKQMQWNRYIEQMEKVIKMKTNKETINISSHWNFSILSVRLISLPISNQEYLPISPDIDQSLDLPVLPYLAQSPFQPSLSVGKIRKKKKKEESEKLKENSVISKQKKRN